MSAHRLEVRDLTVVATGAEDDRAIVDGISFDLAPGEILGLVGESGSGKSMTARALMRLLPASNLRIAGGGIFLGGQDIVRLHEPAMRRIRGRRIGMVFQNAGSHLDPVARIGTQIAETIRYHRGLGARAARAAAIDLLRDVGIPDAAERADSYAHEFSGGMKQRAMIALALACEPDILIADEPTTALDVTVQAQILRLLLDLRDRRGLSIILIAHDLGVVAQSCDTIAVMYGGRICEIGPKRAVLSDPLHRYTAGLIACQPAAAGEGLLATIPGQPPTVGAMPEGCRFHPRCAHAIDACQSVRPALLPLAPDHLAACHVPVRAGAITAMAAE
jgi:peptide/nickel transport system ATP-binding protein